MNFPSRPRQRKILSLALPIIGGMLSQNFLNLVDTLMVSQLGDVALAGVGIASFVHFFCTAFITGMGTGVQATVARRVGEGRNSEAAVPLNGGLLIALAVGIPLSFVFYWSTPTLLVPLISDAEVSRVAEPYLQARFLAAAPLAMNFAFRGYWNGVGLSKVYFRTLLLTHACNIALNYVLIFGHFGVSPMGAEGAGLASALSFWIGSLFYAFQAFSLARENGFLRHFPSKTALRSLVRLSLPTSIQQTFFAGGMTVFFGILARVGTAELAASNVLVNLLLVVILPSIGFGLASATLVGQSLGNGDERGARQWGGDVIRVALVAMLLLGLAGAVAPELLLRPFLSDPETRRLATTPLRVIAFGLPLDAVGLVLMHSMLGAGYAKRIMVISVALQWGLQLPLVYLCALVFHQGLTVIWGAYFAYRAVQTLVLYREWVSGAWAKSTV